MKNKNARAIANGAVCAALSALLMIIGNAMPPLGIITLLAAGIPMMDLGVRFGTKLSATAAAAAILLVFLFTGNILAAVLGGIMNLLPGVVIGFATAKKRGFLRTVAAASAAVLFGILLQLILWNASTGGHGIEDTISQSIAQTKNALDPMLQMLLQKSGTQAQTVNILWNQLFEQVQNYIFLYIPTFLVAASVLIAVGTLAAGSFLLRRVRQIRIPYRPFCLFSAPRSMCYAAMLMFVVTSFSQDASVPTAALKNLVALLYVYFTVCGLSLIDFKLCSKVPSGYARFGIYFAAFLIGYVLMSLVLQGLCILGMIDGIFDFRHLHKTGEERVGHE